MSLLRANPSASLMPSPSASLTPSVSLTHSPNVQHLLNKAVSSLSSALQNSLPHRNMTTDELTMLLGDPNYNEIQSITPKDAYNILEFMVAFVVITGFIGFIVFVFGEKIHMKLKKEKILIHSPISWITNKYKEYTVKEILPVARPKKAKESPFVGPAPMPTVLPNCARLDGAEKGQNIMFRFRGPANTRIESTNTQLDSNETRITIVAVVENSGKPPLTLKI